ncbi:MAG: hypothetical protein AAGA75_25430 [Cyanobacteria bacterium P01_E01_bin.6]
MKRHLTRAIAPFLNMIAFLLIIAFLVRDVDACDDRDGVHPHSEGDRITHCSIEQTGAQTLNVCLFRDC